MFFKLSISKHPDVWPLLKVSRWLIAFFQFSYSSRTSWSHKPFSCNNAIRTHSYSSILEDPSEQTKVCRPNAAWPFFTYCLWQLSSYKLELSSLDVLQCWKYLLPALCRQSLPNLFGDHHLLSSANCLSMIVFRKL